MERETKIEIMKLALELSRGVAGMPNLDITLSNYDTIYTRINESISERCNRLEENKKNQTNV